MKRLPQSVINKITSRIDDIFESIKSRLLGPKGGRKFGVTFNRKLSLPGVYESAVADEGALPDTQLLDQMVEGAENYIDSLKLNAQSKLINSMQAMVTESHNNPLPVEEFHAKLNEGLKDLWTNVGSQLRRVVDTEVQGAKNMGLLQGIEKVNSSVGVEDPTVFYVVVRDNDLCDECKKLHLMSDGVTPRLWKLSELSHGYHKRGDEVPSVSGEHPHCRCALTTLMPSFGFKNGRVTWISEGHNEYAAQREDDNETP